MQKITFSSPPGPEETVSQATQFLKEVYGETSAAEQRLQQVLEEISATGTYKHTCEELEFGARIAWRNSNRCVGRLFWESLEVLDCRNLSTDEEIRKQVASHLKTATNGGKIIPTISIFEGSRPDAPHPIRFLSPQWIRYAGYTNNGVQKGDPLMNEFTEYVQKLGWQGTGADYDLLPVVYQKSESKPVWFELDRNLVLEVVIQHPDFPWIQEQCWKWHAVPLISNMGLYIGGVYYAAAPFNGWYMLTEVAVRNLADQNRYNLLPKIAEGLKLDTSTHKNLWKDRALLILMEAVRYSYEKAGVVLVDHHRADYQFQTFSKNEAKAGRVVHGDWAWLVPPTAGSLTQVFHCEMSNEVVCPNFFYQE
jgi:nitric-oxide synthase, bacterial